MGFVERGVARFTGMNRYGMELKSESKRLLDSESECAFACKLDSESAFESDSESTFLADLHARVCADFLKSRNDGEPCTCKFSCIRNWSANDGRSRSEWKSDSSITTRQPTSFS